MTKDKALHAWFSQFLPSYPTSNVPEDATFPWLTYELITGSWESGEIALTVSLWYYTESEAMPNAKAQEISDAIGMGGCMVAYRRHYQSYCQHSRGQRSRSVVSAAEAPGWRKCKGLCVGKG